MQLIFDCCQLTFSEIVIQQRKLHNRCRFTLVFRILNQFCSPAAVMTLQSIARKGKWMWSVFFGLILTQSSVLYSQSQSELLSYIGWDKVRWFSLIAQYQPKHTFDFLPQLSQRRWCKKRAQLMPTSERVIAVQQHNNFTAVLNHTGITLSQQC